MSEAVFRIEGDLIIPSAYAAGPWNASHQHGAAPAALVARAAERIPTLTPMRVARLNIDLMRPVPLAPLAVSARIVRDGKTIQLSEISLCANDAEVVRASVLKLRDTALVLPPEAALRAQELPLPDACPAPDLRGLNNPFLTGISMRVAKGAFRTPGPAAVWYRADRAVVAGEEISGLMRAAITADFSNGTSAVLAFDAWSFVNADLTISLARDPVGEWILLDAETWLASNGGGIACARLADSGGYFGRAAQSLVVRPAA